MIDSHAHLVTPDIAAFPPAPIGGEAVAPAALQNHLTIEELAAAMERLGIARAVAVQRAHVYGYDNRYVLRAAQLAPDRVAAVGCVDATAADCETVVRAWQGRGIAGFRFSAPNLTTPGVDWFAGPAAEGVWRAASATGASLCLHVFRSNRDRCIAALVPQLERYPDITLVLDHAGNPALEEPEFGLTAVAPLARFAQVAVKISTINFQQLAKAGLDATAFTAAVVARFGAGRVMWGSDVAQSHGSYDAFVALAQAAVAGLTQAERDAVLHTTAERIYFTPALSARSDP